MKQKNKILIVDDDPANLAILHSILKDDYIISVSKSGEKALEIIPKFRPDLVLLDIVMPGLSGYDVCKKIRENKSFSFIKIILVSGKAKVEERLAGYEAGADDYITKPFVREELVAKVRIFLRLKRTEEVDQIKDDILSLFTHETRTPLNAIMGPTQLILMDNSVSDEIKNYASMIQEGSAWLMSLVNKTTILCKLKQENEIIKHPNSVLMYMKTIRRKLDQNAKKKNVKVELDTDQDIILNADWKHMVLVFEYILDNAIKYSPEGGTVKVFVNLNDNKQMINIMDNGPGIDHERIDQIFDEFAIQNIMHHKKGLGVSMAISKIIMEQHGGSINVKCNPEQKETVFTLSFPQENDEE